MTAILLMGLRGCGKSSAGAALAEVLRRPFVDLDDVTLGLLGAATVTDAWAAQGEPAFRAAELEALQKAVREQPDAVIALGGGTPMIEGFDVVSAGTRRVYLHAEPATLRQRLSDNDPNRPALTGTSALEEIETIYTQRHPVYAAYAHSEIDASRSLAQTIEQLKDIMTSD